MRNTRDLYVCSRIRHHNHHHNNASDNDPTFRRRFLLSFSPQNMASKALRGLVLAALLGLAVSSSSGDDDYSSVSPTPAASAAPTAMPSEISYTYESFFNGTNMDTPSPNEPIPKPECNASQTVSVRYSATTGRLYLEAAVPGERGGCVTLDQIWTARGGGSKAGAKAPLYAVDPDTGAYSGNITGTWLLEEDLYVEDGITLKVRHGTARYDTIQW